MRFFAIVVVALGAIGLPGVAPAPAAAGPTGCLAAPPTTSSGFQAFGAGRSADWGVGDLMSMVPLPDGRNLFVFGDTVYAPVNADGSRGPISGFGSNSAWVQSGGCFTLLDSPNGNRSWIAPPPDDGTVYWPGGAAVAGNRLHVFLTRIRMDNMWGTPVGSAVATYELPSLELARVVDVPFHPQRIFGSGAVYDAGYLYAYGSHLEECFLCFSADMYVARVREDLVMVPDAWEYHAGGAGWVADPMASAPVVAAAVSNTNVTPWRNGFLLVTKPVSIVGPEVDAWWAPNPHGPWQRLGTVTSLPIPPPSFVGGYTYKQSFTYSVTLLPTTAVEGGGMLLGYNVGSFLEADGVVDGRGLGPRFVSVHIPLPPAAPPRASVAPAAAPWEPIIAADVTGRVRAVSGGVSYAASHTAQAVGVARTVSGRGSWVVAKDGGVFSVGDAQFYGSTGGMKLNQPVVGLAATPSGRGYWLVAADGGIFSFGDARFYGSAGSIRLNKPILGMAPTPTGRGYWLVASDGGVFAFGDATFRGSMGGAPLNWPITGIASTPSGRGYYMVGLDGGVFTFGDARYHGTIPWPPSHAAVGISVVPGGYRLIDAAGRVFNRGAATGPDMVGSPSWIPIVGVA